MVTIDEASRCPCLVQSIIRDPELAMDIVRDQFFEVLDLISCKPEDLKVQFSMVGTGASAGTTGLIPDKFEVLEPMFA